MPKKKIVDYQPSNKKVLDQLVLQETRAQKKPNTIKGIRKAFALFPGDRKDRVEDIPDDDWHAFLDGYNDSPNTHNAFLDVLNKTRVMLGLPRLVRKHKKQVPRADLNLKHVDATYEKLLGVITTDRDLVIVNVMRYGGLRASEVASLNVGSFDMHDDHVIIAFYREKTNIQARVPVVECAPVIAKYLLRRGGTPDDPAFVSTHENFRGERLSYIGIYGMIKRLCARAGVKFHPHLFRHYRATELAKNGYTKWDLDNMMGWSKTGTTANIYVNLSNDETINKLLTHGGVKVEGAEKDQARHCARCATIVPKENAFCPRCGLTTNPVDALKAVQKEQELQAQYKAIDMKTLLGKLEQLTQQVAELKQQKTE